jgi:hypothetical protein
LFVLSLNANQAINLVNIGQQLKIIILQTRFSLKSQFTKSEPNLRSILKRKQL